MTAVDFALISFLSLLDPARRMPISSHSAPLSAVAQVIGVTGVNPTGRCLLASELHTGAAAPLAATPPDQLARLARRTGMLLCLT